VLVVEDEISYREALVVALSREGYHVQVASDGIEALKLFAKRPRDVVLLDVRSPGLSGSDVCQQMLFTARVPIIMISALDDEIDIVKGLELGATDYVTKPYRLRELVARVRSVLRRSASSRSPSGMRFDEEQEPRRQTLVAGPVYVDLSSRVVTAWEKPVHLSRREFDLLALLLSPPEQVRTRAELIDAFWSDSNLIDTRTLDTHIRRLRMKLERDPTNPRFLVTVRGVGFRFEVDESVQVRVPS